VVLGGGGGGGGVGGVVGVVVVGSGGGGGTRARPYMYMRTCDCVYSPFKTVYKKNV
jgi:hypothetical protein